MSSHLLISGTCNIRKSCARINENEKARVKCSFFQSQVFLIGKSNLLFLKCYLYIIFYFSFPPLLSGYETTCCERVSIFFMFSVSRLFQTWNVKGSFLGTNAPTASPLASKPSVFSWCSFVSSGVRVGFEEASLPAVKWKGWTGEAVPEETNLLVCIWLRSWSDFTVGLKCSLVQGDSYILQ